MTAKIDPCRFLSWDTDFFGHRIAQVKGKHLNPGLVEAVCDWCETQAIDCLYFLANSDDPQSISLAEANGFSHVEVRITLERSLKDWDPETRTGWTRQVCVRPARQEDIPVLQGIARNSFTDSRFYCDKHFSRDKCQEYYETWIRKSCEGRADLVLVAENGGQVVGYIVGAVFGDKKVRRIELLNVGTSLSGIGLGQELLRNSLDFYFKAGIENVLAITQGRNVATQRVFQRLGFLTCSCRLYYHKWFSGCNAKET